MGVRENRDPFGGYKNKHGPSDEGPCLNLKTNYKLN
jgi:hypothetical protein